MMMVRVNPISEAVEARKAGRESHRVALEVKETKVAKAVLVRTGVVRANPISEAVEARKAVNEPRRVALAVKEAKVVKVVLVRTGVVQARVVMVRTVTPTVVETSQASGIGTTVMMMAQEPVEDEVDE
jgi:hypothetical protein